MSFPSFPSHVFIIHFHAIWMTITTKENKFVLTTPISSKVLQVHIFFDAFKKK